MNQCVVTVYVFACDWEFECSSHEYAVSINDLFQHPRTLPNCGPSHMGHEQSQSYIDQWYSPSIDSDIDHEVDYSFHETFGAAHGWL